VAAFQLLKLQQQLEHERNVNRLRADQADLAQRELQLELAAAQQESHRHSFKQEAQARSSTATSADDEPTSADAEPTLKELMMALLANHHVPPAVAPPSATIPAHAAEKLLLLREQVSLARRSEVRHQLTPVEEFPVTRRDRTLWCGRILSWILPRYVNSNMLDELITAIQLAVVKDTIQCNARVPCDYFWSNESVAFLAS
jgi:hypothetical protein